ncbi:MAG: hypothetical protein WC661_01465 [Opitutaceae bacterium]|jgi:hypothetical protein
MPRTIKFAVGGDIMLLSQLLVGGPFVTVDGASAPSPGITVLGDRITFKTHDIIMRHIRIRSSSKIQSVNSTGAAGGTTTDQRDSLQFDGNVDGTQPGYNYLLENCSVSWGVDENMEIYGLNTHDVVVCNCIFSEGLAHSIHWKSNDPAHNYKSHSAGLIMGPGTYNIIVEGNLFAQNTFRNPAISGGAHAVVANNLIYNPGNTDMNIYPDASVGGTYLSAVSNVLIAGPSKNPGSSTFYTFDNHVLNLGSQIYFQDNVSVGVVAFSTTEVATNYPVGTTPFVSTPPEPALLAKVNPLNPVDVEDYVVERVGARPTERDATDTRIINDVILGTGAIINVPPDPRVAP